MAEHRTSYSMEPIFDCFSKLCDRMITIFGILVIHTCDPRILSRFIIRVMKTLVDPKFVSRTPYIFQTLSDGEHIRTERIIAGYLPPYMGGHDVRTVFEDERRYTLGGPIHFDDHHRYGEVCFTLDDKEALLDQAFFLNLRTVLKQYNGEWVDLSTLIDEHLIITSNKDTISEYINKKIRNPTTSRISERILLAEGVEYKVEDDRIQLRFSTKRFRSLSLSDSEVKSNSGTGSWNDIIPFNSEEDIAEHWEQLACDYHHQPANLFQPISFSLLFKGATLLHGEQHGILISMQRLSFIFSSHTQYSYLAVRESSYRLKVYNIADAYVNLYVSYIRVKRDPTFFNIPVFLYDSDRYQLRVIDDIREGCKYYLHKMNPRVEDVDSRYYIGEHDGLSFAEHFSSEDGCFQCWEEGCDFPY